MKITIIRSDVARCIATRLFPRGHGDGRIALRKSLGAGFGGAAILLG